MSNEHWKTIETFLQMIHRPRIHNQLYYLFGHEEGYEKVPTINYGYLPFYKKQEISVTVSIVPSDNTTIRSNQPKKKTEYVVIHNTGMAHPTATAKGLDEYIHTTTRQASWHYSIDDKEAFLQVPLDEVAWHAGDGRTVFGDTWENAGGVHLGGGNQNGIGIESCVYAGVDFNKVMRNVAKLTSKLLVEFDLEPNRIKQHFDFSGKNCPQVIREAGRWEEFLALVEIELFARKYLQDVKFVFTSMSPNIMDHQGTIIQHPKKETTVKYQVTAHHHNEQKTYMFESVLEEFGVE